MAIARLSIQWRITLLVGMCLLIIVGILISTSLQRTSESTALVKERSASILEDSAHQRLIAEGSVQSLAFQRYLLSSYQEGLSLALNTLQMRQLAHEQRLEPAILRRKFTEQVRASLQANPQLLSLYLVFEPNALDGKDADFIGQAGLGSNEIGRFSIYWAQRDGQMSSMATSEAVIMDATPVLDGSPFSTWFDCPKTTSKPCLLSPYFDEASGQRTLITTLSFPLIENGKVIAVAGMDISLQNLQQLAREGSDNLYNGSGEISIVSPSGLLAGHSEDAQLLGQTLEHSNIGNGHKILEQLREGKVQIESDNNRLRALVSLQPIPGSRPWGVLIDAPKETVLQPALELQRELDEQNTRDTQLAVIYGLLATSGGLLLVWLTARGVTKPMRGLSAMLKDIASGGGDLTRRLAYARQDELGELASWFNRFLDKLQPLIADLQRLVREAHGSADRSAAIAGQISNGMQQQYREIDQVATASHEMSASAQDVARNAAQAAKSTQDAEHATRQGLEVINQTTSTIDSLSNAISAAMNQVEGLAARSERIGSVLEVIRSIAEQTNGGCRS